ncbi:MAG: HEAT repeat domain-containing protein [Anaerolineaceae bacterium]|nr:HEAT repeat domain-containing protein [Anaerolineaceae bacterium]
MVSPARLVNSPSLEKVPESLVEELRQIFFEAREEVFEDGMDSVFSRQLVDFMGSHGRLAIDILSGLLLLEKVNAEVAGEALRHVGYIEHPSTRPVRRRLLERCLFGSSARVRDGAIIGLAAMDDPQSIPFVEQAVERESIAELQEDMQAVLEQLRETLAES